MEKNSRYGAGDKNFVGVENIKMWFQQHLNFSPWSDAIRQMSYIAIPPQPLRPEENMPGTPYDGMADKLPASAGLERRYLAAASVRQRT